MLQKIRKGQSGNYYREGVDMSIHYEERAIWAHIGSETEDVSILVPIAIFIQALEVVIALEDQGLAAQIDIAKTGETYRVED